MHSTSSLPPSHVGGVALTSHAAEPLHLAWQLAFALIDAEHFGASNVRVAPPFAVIFALI